MSDMSEAIRRQMDARARSMTVDRKDWTRQQWIDDADRLMNEADGAVTSLVNGHVMALLDEAAECAGLRSKLRTVDRCPDCGAKGRYDARVTVGGRGVYTCPDCGARWQNADEKPSAKGLPLRTERSDDEGQR